MPFLSFLPAVKYFGHFQNPNTLVVDKYVSGTANQPLAGVGFRITDSSGANVGPNNGTYYTDRAGEIMITGLEPGKTITAQEFKAVNGYDEYHYDLDEIGHDPYVLIALLTACHRGAWTLAEMEPTLEILFDRQYTLTERVRTVTRYDSDGEPYSCTICTVTLSNFDLSHLPVYLLDEEQLSMYAGYMVNLGNRPDLFPSSDYPNASVPQDVPRYQVPPEALADEQFAAMLTEAEKYLGFPYVWGGSNPSTSFDCSGYVSWVINHSGWNVGRLGAQALYNLCTPVSPANAKPGDLVFFRYTYKAPIPDGVTHCGIYVGNNMMIHCGNPIQYADLTKSYWQEHFYSFRSTPHPARCIKARTAGKKAENKAVGISKGGRNTKIHAAVDSLGNPLETIPRFV